MRFLVIETSGDDSFVALCMGHKVLVSQTLPPMQQSKLLIVAIQNLLKSHTLTLKDLAFIAVGKGPGSFTGTRIGVMVAKTLSFSKQIPLVPFCSLKRFIPPFNGSFLTLLDAKSNGLYALEGEKQENQTRFLGFPKLLTEKELSPLAKTKLFILSIDIERIQRRFSSLSADLTWINISPNIEFIAQMVYESFYLGKRVSHSEIEVSYLYNSI